MGIPVKAAQVEITQDDSRGIVYTPPQIRNVLEIVDAPNTGIAAAKLVPPGPPHYVVFQGNQPIFGDESQDVASAFILSHTVECKRRGIDVTSKEHELKLTLQKVA